MRVQIAQHEKNPSTMQHQNDNAQDWQIREQELQNRELAVRLRELEAELRSKKHNPDPNAEKTEHLHSEKSLGKQQRRQFLKRAKIAGFSVLGLMLVPVALFIGVWLAYLLVIGGLGFIGFKLFWGKD